MVGKTKQVVYGLVRDDNESPHNDLTFRCEAYIVDCIFAPSGYNHRGTRSPRTRTLYDQHMQAAVSCHLGVPVPPRAIDENFVQAAVAQEVAALVFCSVAVQSPNDESVKPAA